MFALTLPPASVTVYVRVITTGHVPVLASLLATVKSPSAIHASVIAKSPDNPSNPATVVSAAAAAPATQPSTVLSVIDPVTAGAVVSSTVIV